MRSFLECGFPSWSKNFEAAFLLIKPLERRINSRKFRSLIKKMFIRSTKNNKNKLHLELSMQFFQNAQRDLVRRKEAMQREIELRRKEAEIQRREREQTKIAERKGKLAEASSRLKSRWR